MENPNTISHRNINSAVKTILSRKFGGDVRLDRGENIHPQCLYRFKVLSGPDGTPASVFVKRKRSRKIRNEWACLQFLNDQIRGDCPLPRFYGGGYIGKNSVPVIVMEDMGEGQNLRAVLRSNDSQNVEEILMDCAKALGKINAHSIGKTETFHRLRSSIVPIEQKSQDFYSMYIEKWTEICDATGIVPNKEAFSELQALVSFLTPTNGFHALTHGDLYPVNVYYAANTSKVYIFDYEYGDYQHVIVDGFQIRLHLDLWAEVARFPDVVMHDMEDAYRTALAAACPEVLDDQWFYQRLIEACVYETIRCIYRFFEPPKTVFSNTINDRPAGDYEALRTDPNYNHWGLPAVRRRVFYRLGMLAQLTEEHDYLPALGATAKKIRDKYKSIWPPEVQEMPFYTAFQ